MTNEVTSLVLNSKVYIINYYEYRVDIDACMVSSLIIPQSQQNIFNISDGHINQLYAFRLFISSSHKDLFIQFNDLK